MCVLLAWFIKSMCISERLGCDLVRGKPKLNTDSYSDGYGGGGCSSLELWLFLECNKIFTSKTDDSSFLNKHLHLLFFLLSRPLLVFWYKSVQLSVLSFTLAPLKYASVAIIIIPGPDKEIEKYYYYVT